MEGVGRGDFGGHVGVFCSLLKTGGRGKKSQMRLFHGWAFFFSLLFSFDYGGWGGGLRLSFLANRPPSFYSGCSSHYRGSMGR